MASAEVSTIPVKLVFEGDTRRANLQPKFDNLLQNAKQLFGTGNLKFTFTDEEGDSCTISNDSELLEAATKISAIDPRSWE